MYNTRRYARGYLVLVLLVVSCCLAFSAENPVQPVYGGTLRVAISPGVVHLDAQATNTRYVFEVTQYGYETLIKRDMGGTIIPWLARAWETSSDGLTITLYLQDGVRFHDGTPFDASAVKVNLERKIEGELPMLKLISKIESMEIADSLTLRLHLSEPSPGLVTKFAMETFSIYSPTAIETYGNEGLKTRIVGTGPFVLEEYVRGEKAVFSKNNDYWQEGLPYLDQVTLLMIPEPSTRTVMLEAEDIDVALYQSTLDYKRYMDHPELAIRVLSVPSATSRVLELNNQRELFQDPQVRLALNYAIDKQAIIDVVFEGLALVQKCPAITPIVTGYHETGYYPYDPAKADELLTKAGWVDVDGDGIREKDGNEFVFDLWSCKGTVEGEFDITLLVQEMLSKIGCKANVSIVESATWRAKCTVPPEKSEYDALNLDITAYTGDADFIMDYFWRSQGWPPNGYARHYYKNSLVDELIAKGDSAATLSERNSFYAQALEEVYKDPGCVQLVYTENRVAFGEHVHGVQIRPVATLYPCIFAWKE